MHPMTNDTALLRCASCATLNRVPAKRLAQNPICGKCKNLLDFPFQPVNVSAASFDRERTSWLETVLVVFWKKGDDLWKHVEDAVADIAFSQAGRLKVLKADLDAESSLALLFSVQTAPTFLVFRGGKQLGRLDGAPRKSDELAQWVQKHL